MRSEEWFAKRNDNLIEWLSGDKDAIDLLLAINQIIETWDDLIDKDKEIPDNKVNTAFYNALVVVPNNSFYIKHRQYLTPVVVQAINTWLDANELERGTDEHRALAYTLRFMGIQLIQALIFLTGGVQKMRRHSLEVWQFFVVDHENAIEWIRNNRHDG